MKQLVDGLLAAQAELAGRPVASILATLERVTERWLDPADPIRREAEAVLGESTGMAPAMLRRSLDDMLLRVRGIGGLLDEDLGDRSALDRFVPRSGGIRSRAFGPGLLTAVFAGNVVGIPAFDMALALALKSACLARPASGEPLFAGLFAKSVAQVDQLLGRCLAVADWPYDADWPYGRAGAVLAYGSDEAVAAVRAQAERCGGSQLRFVGHGHKVSFAVVAREAATAETARLLAFDVAMYDQQGCVSPHMAFVERGGPLAPAAFAEACASGLAHWEQVMPRGHLSQAEAMALRAVRDEAEFTADALFGSPGNLAWTVVHQEQPEFMPSPLNRLLRTFAVADLEEVASLVAPAAAYLQTVAFAGPPGRAEAVGAALGRLGVCRVSPVGRVQQPSPLWRHDGVPTAAALVRWVDLESSEGVTP